MLARHGHSLANAISVIDTVLPGAELAEIGRAEAKALAVELGTADSPVRKACGGPVIGIVHSAAHRARETATIVGAELGMAVEQIEGIYEVQAGALEGRGDEEGMELYRAVMRRWYEGELQVRMPSIGDGAGGDDEAGENSGGGDNTGWNTGWNTGGLAGESGAEVIERYCGALTAALDSRADGPDGPLLVVSHAAAIRFIAFTLAPNIEPDFIKANPLANCATVVLVPEGDGWRCTKWHEIEFPTGGA